MPPAKIGENTLSWLPESQIGEGARNQISNLAGLPFIFKHVAVMPDCHYGLGATVGSCIPTLGAIIPAAVGVDIGCGLVAVSTPLLEPICPKTFRKSARPSSIRFPLSAGRYNNSVKKTVKPGIEQL